MKAGRKPASRIYWVTASWDAPHLMALEVMHRAGITPDRSDIFRAVSIFMGEKGDIPPPIRSFAELRSRQCDRAK